MTQAQRYSYAWCSRTALFPWTPWQLTSLTSLSDLTIKCCDPPYSSQGCLLTPGRCFSNLGPGPLGVMMSESLGIGLKHQNSFSFFNSPLWFQCAVRRENYCFSWPPWVTSSTRPLYLALYANDSQISISSFVTTFFIQNENITKPQNKVLLCKLTQDFKVYQSLNHFFLDFSNFFSYFWEVRCLCFVDTPK